MIFSYYFKPSLNAFKAAANVFLFSIYFLAGTFDYMNMCGYALDSNVSPPMSFSPSVLLSWAQALQRHMKFGHQDTSEGPFNRQPPPKSQHKLPAGMSISNDNERECPAYVY